jgi:uncharacterized protein (TIGR02145 family)
MMKKNIFMMLLIAATTVTMNLQAQVKIGEDALPAKGAILDLKGGAIGGLLLPNIKIDDVEKIPLEFSDAFSTTDRETNLPLTGTIVYNTFAYVGEGKGVYVWDGEKWDAICAEGKKEGVPLPVPVGCTTGVPEKPVVWMTYNLGAATSATIGTETYDLTTPKGQMKWLTDKTANGGVDDTDATVYGDLYQWGRQTDGHEKRNSTVSSDYPANIPDNYYSNGNGTGQITDQTIKSQFIKTNGDPNDWQKVHEVLSDLWGNGVLTSTPTTPNGNPYNDGQYYQGAVKTLNDPCPSGWRIPTQDEWKTLGDYCNPSSASGIFGINNSINNSVVTSVGAGGVGKAAVPTRNPDLIWVTVANGLPDVTSWSNTKVGGFAIYHKTEWEDAKYADYRSGTKPLYDATAPVPLLYLPAAGYRAPANGNSRPGTDMRYWSSTINTYGYSYSMCLYALTTIFIYDNAYRGSACSIRCVAENN